MRLFKKRRLSPVVLLLLVVCSVPAGARETYPYLGCFEIASRQFQVNLSLLLAVAQTESHWDPDARSDANAHGIMQIRWPLTARHLGAGRVAELYNPCLNINLGARYLRELLDRYDGIQRLALAAYNYGPARIVSSSDIPEKVMIYVHRVEKNQQEITKKIEDQMPPALLKTKGRIEINRFTSQHRAARYIKTLNKMVPEAKFSLSQSRDGLSVVTVDMRNLSPKSRYELIPIVASTGEEANR